MDIAITRMSSKGQVVIPTEMRDDIKEGDKLLIMKDDERIILKKAGRLEKNLEEDLIFAKRTEDALIRYGRGEFKSLKGKDFLKELKKW